jgi:hypothetical protein
MPKTPFDPKAMPGADQRAQRLATVSSAIAQAKSLIATAAKQQADIVAKETAQNPVKPGEADKRGPLARQHYDLQTMQRSLDKYLGALTGYQTGEKQQHQAADVPSMPADIIAYAQSVKDGVPYVAPVHTGE